jgi:uncharacterized membrane protein
MKRAWIFSIILALLLVLPFVSPATIHGKVYDYSLRTAINSVVQLNTQPPQQFVSTNGGYSFQATKGDYVIAALLKDADDETVYYVEENISIVDDGDYVRDLILFPVSDLSELDIEPGIYDPVSLNGDSHVLSSLLYPMLFMIAIILLFLLFRPLFFKKKKEEGSTAVDDKLFGKDEYPADDADELERLLSFVQKHRRVTQKDIRKEFPLSEAKISLMITELEHDGKVRKIKKGRGNVIIFIEK